MKNVALSTTQPSAAAPLPPTSSPESHRNSGDALGFLDRRSTGPALLAARRLGVPTCPPPCPAESAVALGAFELVRMPVRSTAVAARWWYHGFSALLRGLPADSPICDMELLDGFVRASTCTPTMPPEGSEPGCAVSDRDLAVAVWRAPAAAECGRRSAGCNVAGRIRPDRGRGGFPVSSMSGSGVGTGVGVPNGDRE